MNFMPWTSIVVDQRTQETIVYSDTSVYVIPALVNTDNRLYSIAELISSGYASFYRSGDSSMRNFDMRRFFQFKRMDGSGVPRFSSSNGRFEGGMKTNYGSYRTNDNDDDDDNDDYSRDEKYRSKTNQPYRDVTTSSTTPGLLLIIYYKSHSFNHLFCS